MNKWVNDNLATIIGIFMAVIVAGLIGYFSGIIAFQNDIAQLNIKLAALENKLSYEVDTKLELVNDHAQRINMLEKTISILEYENKHLNKQTDLLMINQLQKGDFKHLPLKN
jgi:hypothetical protein